MTLWLPLPLCGFPTHSCFWGLEFNRVHYLLGLVVPSTLSPLPRLTSWPRRLLYCADGPSPSVEEAVGVGWQLGAGEAPPPASLIRDPLLLRRTGGWPVSAQTHNLKWRRWHWSEHGACTVRARCVRAPPLADWFGHAPWPQTLACRFQHPPVFAPYFSLVNPSHTNIHLVWPPKKQTNKQTKKNNPKPNNNYQTTDCRRPLEILHFLLSTGCVSPNNETLNALALASSFIYFICCCCCLQPDLFQQMRSLYFVFLLSSRTDTNHKKCGKWNHKKRRECTRVRFFVFIFFLIHAH